MSENAPCLVLDGARVLAYALVDDSIIYAERETLFVDGKLLGRVPCLAICQQIGEPELLVFYCDNDWTVLGVAGNNNSVEDAKRKVELSYKGLTSKWIDTNFTEEQAIAFLDPEFADEKCSFCGKWPIQVEQMIGENVRICNYCIDEFHAIVHEGGDQMSTVTELHDAVKRGDVERMRTLLGQDRSLANARSETDARGTYPLHVAAEFGQAGAARLLLEYGADVSLLDTENDATALSWAAFFGRSEVVAVLLEAGSEPSQRNKHGLTPLGCAVGGMEGKWRPFSDASLEDWRRAAEIIRAKGGAE